MSPRLARADRLVEYRKLRTSEAEARLGAAVRATAGARDELAAAESARERAIATSCAPSTVDDLAAGDAFLSTLKRRVEASAARLMAATASEERARAALLAARTEQRKLETWREGLAAAERSAEAHAERIATDALAAGRRKRSA